MESLKGKVAIITGASSGIGAALARAFSKREARIVIAARRLEKLQGVARSCPNQTLCVKCDVTHGGRPAKFDKPDIKPME